MGNCCPCFRSDDERDPLHSPAGRRRPLLSFGGRGFDDEGGGGQRLGTAADHAEERRRKAEAAAAARAAIQDEPERRVDPHLTDSERRRQRELRVQAAEKRTEPKKPTVPLSNREFRNPRNDPNTMQWSV